jgi:hypothetical protein
MISPYFPHFLKVPKMGYPSTEVWAQQFTHPVGGAIAEHLDFQRREETMWLVTLGFHQEKPWDFGHDFTKKNGS